MGKDDTIDTIAKKYGMTVREIYEANPSFALFPMVFEGQKLNLSGPEPVQQSAINAEAFTGILGWDSQKLRSEELNLVLNYNTFSSLLEKIHFVTIATIFSNYGTKLIEDKIIIPSASTFDDNYNYYKYRKAGFIQLLEGKAFYQQFANFMNDQRISNSGAEYVAENYPWRMAYFIWQYEKTISFQIQSDPDISICEISKLLMGSKIYCSELLDCFSKTKLAFNQSGITK